MHHLTLTQVSRVTLHETAPSTIQYFIFPRSPICGALWRPMTHTMLRAGLLALNTVTLNRDLQHKVLHVADEASYIPTHKLTFPLLNLSQTLRGQFRQGVDLFLQLSTVSAKTWNAVGQHCCMDPLNCGCLWSRSRHLQSLSFKHVGILFSDAHNDATVGLSSACHKYVQQSV